MMMIKTGTDFTSTLLNWIQTSRIERTKKSMMATLKIGTIQEVLRCRSNATHIMSIVLASIIMIIVVERQIASPSIFFINSRMTIKMLKSMQAITVRPLPTCLGNLNMLEFGYFSALHYFEPQPPSLRPASMHQLGNEKKGRTPRKKSESHLRGKIVLRAFLHLIMRSSLSLELDSSIFILFISLIIFRVIYYYTMSLQVCTFWYSCMTNSYSYV